MPLHSNAQSAGSSNIISVRELGIPLQARHAFEQGIELLAKKDPAGSLPKFQRAIAKFPGYYEAYYRMGAADLQLWRIEDAERAYRASIELSRERYAPPLLALGAILDDQQKFAEAEKVTRKGLALDPSAWTGQYYLGLALFGLNRLADAENSVEEAVRCKADFPQARLLLADILVREKNYSALLTDLEEYLSLDPDSPASARVRALRDKTERILVDSQSAAAVVP
jgi:tetratricopeptide (TPR) repeat protein